MTTPENSSDKKTKPKLDVKASRAGLRTIAFFEAAKGVLVLFVGFGLTAYLHHDARHVVENITHHFHLNPAHRMSAIFIQAVEKASDINLWMLSFGALGYSLLRFLEAYGLWTQRVWAEWLAIVSGGIYLPIEFYELYRHATIMKVIITVINIGTVAYLVWQRLTTQRLESQRDPKRETLPASSNFLV